MKKLLILFVLCASQTFAQTIPRLTAQGVEPVVTEVDSLSASELYYRTKEWVAYYYININNVLGADIENNMIRVNGFRRSFYVVPNMFPYHYDVEYVITFEFKDGRYRYDFDLVSATCDGQPSVHQPNLFFKKKDGSPRKSYNKAYTDFNASLLNLYMDHFDFITKYQKEKDGW